MSQKQVGTRLPDDDVQKLEQYCSERGISKAEALRRSVRKLGEDNDQDTRPGNTIWRLAVLATLGFALLSNVSLFPSLIMAVLGLVSLIIGTYSLL
jgi:hypothetical protein